MSCLSYRVLAILSIFVNFCGELMPMEQPIDLKMHNSQASRDRQCSVCTLTEPEVSFSPLACGHQSSCRMCLQDQIESALMHQGSINEMHTHLRCPNCPYEINEADMRALGTDEQLMTQYNHLLIQEFLNIDHRHRTCPTEGCHETYSIAPQTIVEVIYYSVLGTPNIQCPSCNNSYCPDCQIQHSRFTCCQRPIVRLHNGVRLNNNNAREEDQIDRLAQNIENSLHQLLGKNAKPCPACRVSVEKIDGCRHMTHDFRYGGCGHEFCWNCLKPWERHGWHNGNRVDKFFCNPADLAQVGAHDMALYQRCIIYLNSLGDSHLIGYIRNRHVVAALLIVSAIAGSAFKIYQTKKR